VAKSSQRAVELLRMVDTLQVAAEDEKQKALMAIVTSDASTARSEELEGEVEKLISEKIRLEKVIEQMKSASAVGETTVNAEVIQLRQSLAKVDMERERERMEWRRKLQDMMEESRHDLRRAELRIKELEKSSSSSPTPRQEKAAVPVECPSFPPRCLRAERATWEHCCSHGPEWLCSLLPLPVRHLIATYLSPDLWGASLYGMHQSRNISNSSTTLLHLGGGVDRTFHMIEMTRSESQGQRSVVRGTWICGEEDSLILRCTQRKISTLQRSKREGPESYEYMSGEVVLEVDKEEEEDEDGAEAEGEVVALRYGGSCELLPVTASHATALRSLYRQEKRKFCER